MTENKRFIRIVDHLEKEVRIYDTINEKKIFNIFFNELDSAICLNGALTDTVDLLNDLSEENEQLKQAYTQLEHRHSLLHDECIDAECDRDSYRKDIVSLEKENEQLKSELRNLRRLANEIYMEKTE